MGGLEIDSVDAFVPAQGAAGHIGGEFDAGSLARQEDAVAGVIDERRADLALYVGAFVILDGLGSAAGNVVERDVFEAVVHAPGEILVDGFAGEDVKAVVALVVD